MHPEKDMTKNTQTNSTLARQLAPEDIQSGQFVVVLNEQHQYACGRCTPDNTPEYVVIEVLLRPDRTRMPRIVLSMSLPFVLVENFAGKKELLDVRKTRLALVSDEFAYAAL